MDLEDELLRDIARWKRPIARRYLRVMRDKETHRAIVHIRCVLVGWAILGSAAVAVYDVLVG